MPCRPGFQPVIIDGQAAAVIGGTVEISVPEAPCSRTAAMFGQVRVGKPDDGIGPAVEPDHQEPGHQLAGTSMTWCTRSAGSGWSSPAAGTELLAGARS